MKAHALWMMLSIAASCAAQCMPPEPARAKLAAYLEWESGLQPTLRPSGPFSLLQIGKCTAFKMDNRSGYPENLEPRARLVYLYVPGQPLIGTGYLEPAEWVGWVLEYMREPANFSDSMVPQCGAKAPERPPCNLTLEFGPWKPSPDGPEKRKVAREILEELRAYGHTDSKEVYVRDFNVHDPDIWFYIVKPQGESTFEGCDFELDRSRHCWWHLFGQSPAESLKRVIMSRPYRLYPPPVGKP